MTGNEVWNAESIKKLTALINRNGSIKTFDFSNNGISVDIAWSFTQMIKNNQKLENLNYSGNDLNYILIEEMAAAIEKNTSLQKLKLDFDALSQFAVNPARVVMSQSVYVSNSLRQKLNVNSQLSVNEPNSMPELSQASKDALERTKVLPIYNELMNKLKEQEKRHQDNVESRKRLKVTGADTIFSKKSQQPDRY